jgi:ATP dependent DNA ligase domain
LRPPLAPMEALAVDAIPTGNGWLYEPKWDGFRCLVFRNRRKVVLQSKAGRPLTRYFPDLVEAALSLKADHFVLDGEIVVPQNGAFSFDDLLQRETRATHRAAGVHRQRAGRSKPMVHRPLSAVAAAEAEARGRGSLRPFCRAPFPPRNETAALAARQIAAPVHHGSAHAEEGKSRKAVELELFT